MPIQFFKRETLCLFFYLVLTTHYIVQANDLIDTGDILLEPEPDASLDRPKSSTAKVTTSSTIEVLYTKSEASTESERCETTAQTTVNSFTNEANTGATVTARSVIHAVYRSPRSFRNVSTETEPSTPKRIESTTVESSHMTRNDFDGSPALLGVGTTKHPGEGVCQEESKDGVTWSKTAGGSIVTSSPLCLDENLKILKRSCDKSGNWLSPAPTCSSVQKPIRDPCPSDLQWTYDSYCVKIFENTTFPPPCPYSDLVDFAKYVDLELTTKPIWMPLKMIDDLGGIDLIRWTEINENYKTPYNICTTNCKQYYFEGSFLDKKCLVYHNSTHTEAVRCDSYHAALCVYQPLANKQMNYCNRTPYQGMSCKQSDYQGDSQCFCKGVLGHIGTTTTTTTTISLDPQCSPTSSETILPAAEFINPYQNLLFSNLKEICSFGLLQNDTEVFVWAHSRQSIDYANWVSSGDINFSYKYGVFSPEGWNLRETIEENTCVIYQIQPEFIDPNITLTFDHKYILFELHLTHTSMWYQGDDGTPLVFCFTDADSSTLMYRIAVFNKKVSEDSTIYTFPPYGETQSGSGRYWCEAFKYPYLERKTTDTNFVLKNTSYAGEYVTILKLKQYVSNGLGKNPLTQENFGVLQISLKNELFNFNTSFYPRIFKICDIDESAEDITVNFHLTSSASRNNRTEYETLKQILKSQQRFEFVDFRSVDYCYSELEVLSNEIIKWPTTPINHYAKLDGYCVSDEGNLVKKLCGGNFVDGAIWQPISENCSIYTLSNITDAFIKIIESNDYLSQAQELLNIMDNLDQFSAFDVVLVAKYLQRFVSESTDLQLFGQIVNKVMNTPRIILLAAQSRFRATDKILSSIDTILANPKLGQKDLYYSFDNLALKVVNIKQDLEGTFQGIILHDCNLTKNCSLSEIRASMFSSSAVNRSVYAGVYLSPNLLNQLVSMHNQSYVQKISLAIYYNPVLFNEITGMKNASIVFGILLPQFEETFEGPLTLIFNDNVEHLERNCSFWKFDTEDYSEWESENSSNANGATWCEYWHLTNLAATFENRVRNNVSQKLKDASIQRNSEKIQSVMEISNLYRKFTSQNVKELSEALENITISTENQLEMLKCIIKNILNLPRDTLRESQNKYSVAEEIIDNISIIISKMENARPLENLATFRFGQTLPGTKFGHIIFHNATDSTLLLGKSKETLLYGDSDRTFLTMKFKAKFLNEYLTKPSCGVVDTKKQAIPSFIDNFTNALSLLHNDAEYCYIPKSNFFQKEYLDSCVIVDNSKTFSHFTRPTISHRIIDQRDKKLTEALLEILENNSPSVRMNQLELLLRTHRNHMYDINDVHIISSILYDLPYLIFRDNFLQLMNFANILDDIISFNKKVMFDAQVLYQASDKILQATKNILSEYEGDAVIIEQDNFWLMIASQKDVDFGGIFVKKINEQWSISFLNAVNTTNSRIDDFVLTIKMDQKLRNQIRKYCVLIFYENTLFSSAENRLTAQPVVKILFPDLETSLEGNISLTYRGFSNSQNDLLMCSFWQYEVKKTMGHWHQDTTAQTKDSPAQNDVVCNFDHVTNFALVTTDKNITTNLEGILNSTNLSGEQKLDLVHQITSDVPKDLLPVDVYLISQIFQNTMNMSFYSPNLTASIVSNLFNVPKIILKASQATYNATDKILYAIDRMATKIEETLMNKPNFALLVQSVKSTDLVGLMVGNCTETVCDVLPLSSSNFSDKSLDTFSAMVLFSETLIDQIKKVKDPRVIIAVFYDNSLFNEYNSSTPTAKIFGVHFPGLDETMNGTVSVAYKVESAGVVNNKCAYWKFVVNATHPDRCERGRWKNDVDKYNFNSLTFCNFSHTTHFALLLADEETAHMHDAALTLLTNINCALSLVGLIGIMLTAMLFEKWRNNTGNKILVNNSIAITLKISMLYISDFMYDYNPVGAACTLTGMALHYAMLSECCWMLIIAILQFKRFVEVMGGPPKYVMVKALVCGWIFPVIPVLCVIVIDPDNYVNSVAGICYPTNLGLYLGVWLPVLIILSINCVIFVFIMYNIFRKKTECKVETTNHEILFQWRLALLLFFILGLTWVFGFLAQIKGDVVFVYLFCFTSTLQGFVMFWFFIVFNKSTRVLYTQAIKQWFYEKGILKIKHSKNSKY